MTDHEPSTAFEQPTLVDNTEPSAPRVLPSQGGKDDSVVGRGRVRYQKGLVAFPDFICYSDARVMFQGVNHCPVCAQPDGPQLHFVGDRCLTIKKALSWLLLTTPLLVPRPRKKTLPTLCVCPEQARSERMPRRDHDLPIGPIMRRTGRHDCTRGTTRNASRDHMPHSPFCLHTEKDTKTASSSPKHRFDVHAPGKECSFPVCALCETGGHIYSDTLGKERYGRGFMACPESVFLSTQGYTSAYSTDICLVCGTPTGRGHRPRCEDMTRVLKWTLDITCVKD